MPRISNQRTPGSSGSSATRSTSIMRSRGGNTSNASHTSTPRQKRPAIQRRSKSAWALASPRFAGDTRYHEAMSNKGDDRSRSTTPRRLDQPKRTPSTRRNRRAQSCTLTRGRNGFQSDEETYQNSVPALEVSIPSFCADQVRLRLRSSPSPSPCRREDVSPSHTFASTITSPPKGRHIHLDYPDHLIPRSPSPTFSHISNLPSVSASVPSKLGHHKNEQQHEKKNLRDKKASTSQPPEDNQDNYSDCSGFKSLPWNSSNNVLNGTKPISTTETESKFDDSQEVDSTTIFSCDQSQIKQMNQDMTLNIQKLLLSVQKLENNVTKLTNEAQDKDELIEELTKTLEVEMNLNDNKSSLQNDDSVIIGKQLQYSEEQDGYSCNLDLQRDGPDEQSLIEHSKDEMKVLKELHQNEIMALKEIHRRDFLSLQDKTLKWIVSKSDLMQEQSKSLAFMREEVLILKENYNDIKNITQTTFLEAQEAVAKNCETLASYVDDEIRESEEAANVIINGLEDELENAYEQISLLKNIRQSEQEACEVVSGLQEELESAREQIALLKNTPKSSNRNDEMEKSILQPSFISNIQSWDDFTDKFRAAINGKMPLDEDTETTYDSDAILKAESLFNELSFDTSCDTNSSMESDEFLDSFDYEQVLDVNYSREEDMTQNLELVTQ